MLNLPLSLLSDDLLGCIVHQVAKLPFSNANKHLYNLSLSDRAFTRFCQAQIFKILNLGHGSGSERNISKKLLKMRNILDDEPSFAKLVRIVKLTISHKRNGWLFNDPTFISIVQLLAKSLKPPYKLCLFGFTSSLTFEDPIHFVGRLTQTFFSQTLTVLHLYDCTNVPFKLTLFLVCPRLRDILLTVGATEMSYDEYPDEQCSSRELPALEYLT